MRYERKERNCKGDTLIYPMEMSWTRKVMAPSRFTVWIPVWLEIETRKRPKNCPKGCYMVKAGSERQMHVSCIE